MNNFSETVNPTILCTDFIGGIKTMFIDDTEIKIRVECGKYSISNSTGIDIATIQFRIECNRFKNYEFKNLLPKQVVAVSNNGEYLVMTNLTITYRYQTGKAYSDFSGLYLNYSSRNYTLYNSEQEFKFGNKDQKND